MAVAQGDKLEKRLRTNLPLGMKLLKVPSTSSTVEDEANLAVWDIWRYCARDPDANFNCMPKSVWVQVRHCEGSREDARDLLL